MSLFYEIVQIALGNRKTISKLLSTEEWQALFLFSQKQAISGVILEALETLSAANVKPPMNILYEWIGLGEIIKTRNQLVNSRCGDLTQLFEEAGFRTCILKGQGNALMYPKPLSRTSGDIDIWVEGERQEIRRFVKSKYPEAMDGDMHIDFPFFQDVDVEVHYKPRYDVRPKYEKRLQKWIKDRAEEQFCNKFALEGKEVCFPTAEFNVVMQMSHLMGHFFVEGIGLRQFMDYYYLLQLEIVQRHKESLVDDLAYLGLDEFASGVMWVLCEVFAMKKDLMIVEPDARIGKLILKEIEEGGNFGYYDQRYNLRKYGTVGRGMSDFYRLATLIPYFPCFALWKMWDKIKGQRWKL
jgi:hypothetical protein